MFGFSTKIFPQNLRKMKHSVSVGEISETSYNARIRTTITLNGFQHDTPYKSQSVKAKMQNDISTEDEFDEVNIGINNGSVKWLR